MCCSVDNPDSLQNIAEKWNPEIKHFCPGVPIIVVGNKADIRDDARVISELSRRNRKPVQSQEGHDVARQIGARSYMECSAKENSGVKEIFQEALKIGLVYQQTRRRHVRKCRFL